MNKSNFSEYDVSEFDVKKYFDDQNIEYKTGGKNTTRGWIEIHCVFPGCADHSEHLGINLKSGLITCWICGKKGSALHIIQEIEQCSYPQAIKIALKYPKNALESDQFRDHSQYMKEQNKTTHGLVFPAEMQNSWPVPHLNYLRSRGFDPDQLINKYSLKPVHTFGNYRFRIIAPIFLNGRAVSWIAADILRIPERIPYLDCPENQSIRLVKHCLYNIDTVRDTALIVEGITDVWNLGDGAVGTFTSNFTKEQILLLIEKKVKRAFVLYDPDAAKKGKRLGEQLSGIIPHVENIILDKGDPADMTKQEVMQLRRDIFGNDKR
jgi:DNA primase